MEPSGKTLGGMTKRISTAAGYVPREGPQCTAAGSAPLVGSGVKRVSEVLRRRSTVVRRVSGVSSSGGKPSKPEWGLPSAAFILGVWLV